MNIVMVAPEVFPVPPVRGGAVETVIEEVAAQLRGHEVTILGIADASLPLHETQGHRTYRRWRRGWFDHLLLSSWKLPFKQSSSPWYYWPYQRWIAEQLKQLQPDVVWVHSRIQFVPAIRRAAPQARVILSVHNESNLQGDGVWHEDAIGAVDVVTGCSRFLTEAITRQHPSCAGKTTVLYNGVNPEMFAPRWARLEERKELRKELDLADRPVALYVGRLVEAKGVHVLIDAFKRVIDQGLDASLVIAGAYTFSDGRRTQYIDRLRTQAISLGERVRFVGHISREEIHQYFLMSDVLAFPSIWQEPFGMVILEAQAAGLPVIAFDQGGPSEIIRHGKDGVLVPKARGAEGFAEVLAQCLSDSTMREVIGREARWNVEERFTWESVAREFLKLCAMPQASRAPVRIVIAESGTGYGGSAKYLSELLSVLDRRRYDVQVIAAEDGPFVRRISEQGVPVTIQSLWRFPWGRNLTKRSVIAPLAYTVNAVTQLLVMVPIIMSWLRRRRVHIVHLNNELLSHVPLAVAAKLAGCRVVCHLHGWRSLTATERWAARFVDEFVCISDAGAQFHRKQLSAQRVRAIPNGIILNGQVDALATKRLHRRQQLGVRESDVVIAIIGRLVSWKGHETYLRGLASVLRAHPQLVGLIVGHDPSPDQQYLTSLQTLAKALNMTSRLRWMPWQDDVWSIYAAADVIVHASTQPEPFGLVLVEAMAAGKPVIATRAGGVVDIVRDGETGFLVEPRDVDGLARALTQLIEDRTLANRLGQRGREVVHTTFTIERNAAQVTDMYDQLTGHQR